MSNRIIKFRAWDKTANTGMIECDWNWLGERSEIISDYILMQFTGLLDRNGKEIYEGDVLRGKANLFIDSEKDFEPSEVCWNQDQSGYTLMGFYGIPLNAFLDSEIIGNIYEHPNLLA